MKKQFLYLFVFILVVLNFKTINAAEFLIRDEVHTFTEADCGFYWWYDMSAYPSNWYSPNDYWNGNIHVRVEVISQPTNTPFRLSYIMWEACSGTTGELAGKQTDVGSSGSPRVGTSQLPLRDFYPVNGGIDMNNAYQVSKMGVDIRDEYGTAVACPNWGYPDYPWSSRANWYPLQVRFTIVAVSAGSTFSGWSNYTSGGPAHGYSSGPSDNSACQEDWGSGSSSSSSSSSSSGGSSSGCDPEFIDDSPVGSALAIEAESMIFNGYFVQGLMGASNGNVAGLWSAAEQNSTGSISVNFPHSSGIYDVNVVYLDENDGASPFRFKINGVQHDTWNGILQDCQNKYTVRTISSQSIQSGDVISIEGDNSDGAFAKVDYIDFVKLADASCKIMPLGTSVTFDQYLIETRPVGERGGYRKHLYNLLNAAGLEFDFVGSETGGQNVFPDPENAGFPGITAPQLLQLLRTGYNSKDNVQETGSYYLDEFMPEIIVLEIGTNGFTTDVATLDSILNEIDYYKLRTGITATTILAQIINRNPLHPETSVYNSNIASLVASRADVSIILIDMENDAGLVYSSPPAGDMQDQLHPTDRGYNKIAQLIVDEILRVKGLLGSTPDFLTVPETSVSLGEAFYYNAHAASGSKPQYSLNNEPSGMTIDPVYGLINWAPSAAGNFSFDVIATNGSQQSSQHIEFMAGNSFDQGIMTVLPTPVTNPSRRAQALVMPQAGTIQSISMYHQGGSGQARFAVYDDNGGFPGNKIAETALFTVDGNTGWQTESLISGATVASDQMIWLAWVYENPPVLFYGSGTPGRASSSATFSGGMPSTFGTSTVTDYQYSIYCTYTSGSAPVTSPDAPTNLTAANETTQISLSWQHNQQNTTGFNIERKLDGGSFSEITSVTSSTLAYTDTDVAVPGTYTYRVSAFNSEATSAFSNEAAVIISSGVTGTIVAGYTDIFTQQVYNPNRRAQQVTISQGGLLTSITMYHGSISGNVIYAVYNDAGNAPGSMLGVTPSTSATQSTGWQTINLISPVPVSAGQKVWLAWVYQYSAPIFYTNGTPGRAHSTDTWSSGMPGTFGTASFSDYIYSIYASIQVGDIPVAPPVAPENLSASHTAGTTVQLNWDDVSDNETGFVLERMPVGGSFAVIANLGVNTEFYSDNAPATNTSFVYRLKAINGEGESDYSNTTDVFIPEPSPVAEAGYHSIFNQTVYNANRRAQKIIMPETGILQQISMYHGSGSGSLIYAVYSDNGGFPGTRMAQTAITPIAGSTAWQTVDLISPVEVGAGEAIWLAWLYENSVQLFYETGGEGRANSTETWPGGMPADFGTSTVTDYMYSIFAIYEPFESNDPPVAPSDLTGNYDPFSMEILLGWNDNSYNETSFVLERAINGGSFNQLAVLAANATSYSDLDVNYNTTYQYRIYAMNDFGNSANSSTYEIIASEPSASPIAIGNNEIFDMQVMSAYRRAQQITVPSDGQLTAISMYHGGASGNLLFGVYDDASNQPGTLLASTPETAVSTVTGWQEVELNAPLNVTEGEKVWLAWVYQHGSQIYFTSGTPGRAHADEFYTGNLPVNFNAASFGNYIYSIYATLQPSGGAKSSDGIIVEKAVKAYSPFVVYPNPAINNTFYIDAAYGISEDEIIQIEVADLTGKIIYREDRRAGDLVNPFILRDDLVRKKVVLLRITTHEGTAIHKLVMHN